MNASNQITVSEFTRLLSKDGWTHSYEYNINLSFDRRTSDYQDEEEGDDLDDDFGLDDCLPGFEYYGNRELVSVRGDLEIRWMDALTFRPEVKGGMVINPEDHFCADPLYLDGFEVVDEKGEWISPDVLLALLPPVFISNPGCDPALALQAGASVI